MKSNHFRNFNFKDCFSLPKRRCDKCDLCQQKILDSDQKITDAQEEMRRVKDFKPSLSTVKKRKVSIEQKVTPCLTPKLLKSSSCLADRALDFAKAIGPIVLNTADENRCYSVSIINKKSAELTENSLSGKPSGIEFDNVTVNVSLGPSHVIVPFDTGCKEEITKSVESKNLDTNISGTKNVSMSIVHPNLTTNNPKLIASDYSNIQNVSKKDDDHCEDKHHMRKDLNELEQEGNSFNRQQYMSSDTLRGNLCFECKHQRLKNRNAKKSKEENFVSNASHQVMNQTQEGPSYSILYSNAERIPEERDDEGSSEPSSVESPERIFDNQTKCNIKKKRKRDSISTELKDSLAQSSKNDEKNISLKVYSMTDTEKKKFTEDICSKVEAAITSKFEIDHAKHLSELKGVESALAANAKKLNSVLKRLIEIENKMSAGGNILRLEDKQNDLNPKLPTAMVDFDRIECTNYAGNGVTKMIAGERADPVSKTSVLYQQKPEKLIKNLELKESCKVVEASNDANDDDVCAESLDSSSNSLSGLVVSNSLSLKQGTRQCWNPAK